MNPGPFLIIVGVAVILLSTTILPALDRAIAARSSSRSVRRSEAWRRFQRTNTKQAVVFGCFLVCLGVVNLVIR